MDTII